MPLTHPIAAGHPLLVTPDSTDDERLAFRLGFATRFTRPVVLRVGRKTAAMQPTIEPGDVVLIDQNLTRRRHPPTSVHLGFQHDAFTENLPAILEALQARTHSVSRRSTPSPPVPHSAPKGIRPDPTTTYALRGWRQRTPLKRAKSLSVVTSSHACSMASAAR